MKLSHWSKAYWEQIQRNIGLISISDQEQIRITPITIFGTGGLGGPILEQLVRCGCEQITICDNERYEVSNLNRQLCSREDLGRYKIDVLEEYVKHINPNVSITKYNDISENNILEILKNSEVAALTLDDAVSSIIIARTCLKRKIPLVESWAMPYLFAWWFTEESINYETCYNLNTKDLSISQIRNNSLLNTEMLQGLFRILLKLPKFKERYNREEGMWEKLISGVSPSITIAPIVRLTASFLAFELIYSGILKVKKKILAPRIMSFDYFDMTSININL